MTREGEREGEELRFERVALRFCRREDAGRFGKGYYFSTYGRGGVLESLASKHLRILAVDLVSPQCTRG